MKVSLGLITLSLTAALGQQVMPACPPELVTTEDCAAVINPNACYNQFRWNTRTLGCIEGTDDRDRARKVCPGGSHLSRIGVSRQLS